LRVETPQELPNAVAEPVALLFQVLRPARPLPQFDHHRIERLQSSEAARVGAQRVAQHLRVPAVILGASRREAVPEAIELLGRAAWASCLGELLGRAAWASCLGELLGRAAWASCLGELLGIDRVNAE